MSLWTTSNINRLATKAILGYVEVCLVAIDLLLERVIRKALTRSAVFAPTTAFFSAPVLSVLVYDSWLFYLRVDSKACLK